MATILRLRKGACNLKIVRFCDYSQDGDNLEIEYGASNLKIVRFCDSS